MSYVGQVELAMYRLRQIDPNRQATQSWRALEHALGQARSADAWLSELSDEQADRERRAAAPYMDPSALAPELEREKYTSSHVPMADCAPDAFHVPPAVLAEAEMRSAGSDWLWDSGGFVWDGA